MHMHSVIDVAVPERLCHGRIHGAGDGIFLFRPVEADDLHRAFAFDQDMFAHAYASSADLAAARLAAPVMTVSFREETSASMFSAKKRHRTARPLSLSASAARAR